MKQFFRALVRRILYGAGTETFWRHREKAKTAKTALFRAFHRYRGAKICYANGASIPDTAQIDGCLTLPHGLSGVFISKGAVIGRNCTVFQQVTIGSNAIEGSKSYGAPRIGDNVYIGAGAKIIGGVTVGDNVRIGANCVVTESVPANSTVVLQKPRVIVRPDGQTNTFHTIEL